MICNKLLAKKIKFIVLIALLLFKTSVFSQIATPFEGFEENFHQVVGQFLIMALVQAVLMIKIGFKPMLHHWLTKEQVLHT